MSKIATQAETTKAETVELADEQLGKVSGGPIAVERIVFDVVAKPGLSASQQKGQLVP